MNVKVREFEAQGFKLIATTTYSDGVSFEAHQLSPKKLIRGQKCATADLAFENLLREAGLVSA